MATALAGISLIGGIVQSIGQRQEAESAARTAEINAQLARQDAEITQKQIEISEAARGVEKGIEQKRLKGFVSTQSALYAKAGVTLSGSPLAVMEESVAEGELDIIMGDINASMEQLELERKKSAYEVEAFQKEATAARARSTGRVRAGLTLLTAGADYGSKMFKPKE